jgi:hypothetical protein
MAKIRSGASTDELTVDAASKAARVTIYDNAGNEVGATLDSDGHFNLEVSTTQNVIVATGNSSVANINNGDTFTGATQSTLGVNGIQVSLFSDKILTMYVDQSSDNAGHWDIVSLPIICPANAGIARTVLAVASYFRVRVVNASGSNTTSLRLQTCLCPICDGAIDMIKQPLELAWEEMVGGAAAESALTNYTTGTLNGVALGADNKYTVTAGRRLQINGIGIYIKATGTVTNLARFRIRMATTVANTSPIIFDHVLVGSAAGAVTAGAGASLWIPFATGIEVMGGQQITFTWFTSATTCTVGMTINGYEF